MKTKTTGWKMRITSRKVIDERRASVRHRLMAPRPPEGAHQVSPWGYGMSSAEADRHLRKWRALLSIYGSTIDEIASKMNSWGA